MEIKLFNTLTGKKDIFSPLNDKQVGLYTCGPTVYNYAHIGNLRTYIFEDILKRVLVYNSYSVKHVMNITDVGHLTGDRDMGEDKMEKGAKREGKTAWGIAEFYTESFKNDIRRLNILEPDIWCKATDHIAEQINLIEVLEKKGFTYKISDGIYFDTSKFKKYTELSKQKLEALWEGARVERNEEKKNPTDFALWKFSSKDVQRQMEWDSPWGRGFPGWHLECSAMSMKYLGKQFDVHCGGVDHINTHHTNEIAQSEAATGKSPWVKYWMHGEFLNIIGGRKMAKSGNNFLTLQNALINKGINPLVYRFAALQVHYRKPMEYGEAVIVNARRGLEHLYNQIRGLGSGKKNVQFKKKINKDYRREFINIINDDLNTPRALALLQKLLKSRMPAEEIIGTALNLDKVLGLDLRSPLLEEIPEEIKVLANQREHFRKQKEWERADEIRKKLESEGYLIEDAPTGIRIYKNNI